MEAQKGKLSLLKVTASQRSGTNVSLFPSQCSSQGPGKEEDDRHAKGCQVVRDGNRLKIG